MTTPDQGGLVDIGFDDAELTLCFENAINQERRWCFGKLEYEARIPYQNILYCAASESCLHLDYAERRKGRLQLRSRALELRKGADLTKFEKEIMYLAYLHSIPSKRILVLTNPASGRGRAVHVTESIVKPYLHAAKAKVDIRITSHVGHARSIAREVDVDGFDAIWAVSGDGTPYEVFNGLYEHSARERALKIPVCQIPAGSGNAMCLNTIGNDRAEEVVLALLKGYEIPLDLCKITQGDIQHISFLSTSFGIMAECDLGTEHLRKIFGSWRFVIGFFTRLMRNKRYPCKVTLEILPLRKAEIADAVRKVHNSSLQEQRPPFQLQTTEHVHLELPRLQTFYAGNMSFIEKNNCFFPAALPHDGCLDVAIMDGNVTRLQALQCVSLVSNGRHFFEDYVSYYKVVGFRIDPMIDSDLSVDGERMPPLPTTCKVLPGMGRTLATSMYVYKNTNTLWDAGNVN